MTPQSNFMIVAPIDRAREAELRALLESMNKGPGLVKADNALVPFAQFDTLHFARFVILDDKDTRGDARAHGMPVRELPAYLAFLGDIDGDRDTFLEALAQRAQTGLRSIFSCCEGFAADTDLIEWMKRRETKPIAAYVNCRGRTVRRIHEEAALRDALNEHLRVNAAAYDGIAPLEIRARVAQFVDGEKAAGRLTLSADGPTPIGWWIHNVLHLIGVPLVTLLALPLLIVVLPILTIRIRQHEKTDPELVWRVDAAYSNGLAHFEDRIITNQFTAFARRKPGIARLLGLVGVLVIVDYAARHIVRPGRLARIRSIHFARWVLLDDMQRGSFFSNYDGTVEAYMDDFTNKAGFGLNAIFCNAIGYPRTNWLIRDGCKDGEKYRNFLRRHTLPTQVWFKAYPELTAVDLERNSRIREGLESTSMNDAQAREWVSLL